ncbi:hypothetical protein [Zhihengliuella halotolerans]|uniref:Uncharacterized protein n=1 Tax=Zhihengliuella halotolerans TaxID=370736 RepID=A0A4Q8ABL8_9MICC|nr:hypothetical protein [Zhihengliuella halotolerans]RZU61567.1 hypothetical protein EV380_1138 [Zhihengliuella halotolerans]
MGRQASQDTRGDAEGILRGARHARQDNRFAIPAGYADPYLPPIEPAPLLGTTQRPTSPAEPHEDTSFINLISLVPTADKLARKRFIARSILILAIAAVPAVILGLMLT